MNGHLHPGVLMPVFGYLSADGVKAQLSAADAPLVAHAVVSMGSNENGWRTSSSDGERAESCRSPEVSCDAH
jgi:hypothetical protein